MIDSREREIYIEREERAENSMRAIDPSTLSNTSQMPSIKNGFDGLSDACSIDTGILR